ncbi:MAG: hypothetical protein ACE5F9_14305 [Phycisphaerae bacterium]
MQPRFHVIGLGSWGNGDDAAGLLSALKIRDENIPGVSVTLDTAGGGRLLDHLDARVPAIILDASRANTDLPRNQWRRLVYPQDADLLPDIRLSHVRHFSLAELLDLAQRLGHLPHHTWVYVIAVSEAQRYQAESRELLRAIPGLVRAVVHAIRSSGRKAATTRRRPTTGIVPARHASTGMSSPLGMGRWSGPPARLYPATPEPMGGALAADGPPRNPQRRTP